MMKTVQVPDLILINSVTNDEFTRECIPFIRTEFFEDITDQEIFRVISEYFNKTSNLINKNILSIELNESSVLHGENLEKAKEKATSLFSYKPEEDNNWLRNQAEKWCQDRAVYLAIVKAISIYDGTEKKIAPHAIPELLSNALSVSFRTHIGDDWDEDAEARYERYSSPENKISFDLDTLNDITFGGVKRKTLNIILGGVHVGKTFSLVHLAAGYVRLGYNVFYASMEMDEDDIMIRVDANMLKTPIHSIKELGKEVFLKKINRLKSKSYGKLKVLQFPTSVAHSGHIEAALNELKLKKKWVPDVVMVDYLGVVASSRVLMGGNSHFYLKSVAEELRAMGIKNDYAVWSAMQVTRAGMSSTDLEMTDTAESIGITAVADFILGATRTDELDAQGQIAYKQLKNRYRSMSYRPKFLLGSNFDCQMLLDLQNSQQILTQDGAVVDVDTGEIQKRFESSIRRRRNITIDIGDC